MLKAIICPVGMCCSMWQWNSQVPGLSARKRRTAQLLRQRLTMSFCRVCVRFRVPTSLAASYGQPQYASKGNLVPGSPARAFGQCSGFATASGRKKHSKCALLHQDSEYEATLITEKLPPCMCSTCAVGDRLLTISSTTVAFSTVMKGTPSAPHWPLVCRSGVAGFFHGRISVNMYILSLEAYGETPSSKDGPATPTSRTYVTSASSGSGAAFRLRMSPQLERRFVSHAGPATACGSTPPPVPAGGL
mmetsp:Transcript_46587/g.120607  ORF Transcript_46587/g.120607 Transcript_46587/m.120607 type:complete len:247 (+) Transcript_46587:189-929(+)